MINKDEVIDIVQYYGKSFELVIQIRDSNGNPTGRTKSFSADTSSQIAHFWYKNRYLTKKKGSKKSSQTPDDKEAAKILKEMYGDK